MQRAHMLFADTLPLSWGDDRLALPALEILDLQRNRLLHGESCSPEQLAAANSDRVRTYMASTCPTCAEQDAASCRNIAGMGQLRRNDIG